LNVSYHESGSYFFVKLGGKLILKLISIILPMVFLIMISIVVMNWSFHGMVFSLHPIKPDFKRLNPIDGIKNIFSKKILVELFKVVFKIILMMGVLIYFFMKSLDRLLDLSFLSITDLLHRCGVYISIVVMAILAIMLLATIFDVWYSKSSFAKQMRMSSRDVKDEYKRREGNPEVKSKRRQIQQELFEKIKALQQVKNADVIVTNPTHYAIALRYRSKEMLAPTILSMGKGGIAKLIIRLAYKHRIPIIRQPVLARKIYKVGTIGNLIPPETQKDVVKVYQWVLSLPHHKVDL
jgi:flagellar biosynthetic protein FlhB